MHSKPSRPLRFRDCEAPVQVPGPPTTLEYDSGPAACPSRPPYHSRTTISRGGLPALRHGAKSVGPARCWSPGLQALGVTTRASRCPASLHSEQEHAFGGLNGRLVERQEVESRVRASKPAVV